MERKTKQIELQRVESTAQKPQIDYLVNGVHIVHDRKTNKVIFGKEDCAAAGISSLDIPEDIHACIDLTKKQKALATVLRSILSSEQPYVAFRMEDLVGDDTVQNYTEGFSSEQPRAALAFLPDSGPQIRSMNEFTSSPTLLQRRARNKVENTIALFYGPGRCFSYSVARFTTTETTGAIVVPHLDKIRPPSGVFGLPNVSAYKQVIFYPEVEGLESTLELSEVPKDCLFQDAKGMWGLNSRTFKYRYPKVKFLITPKDEGLVVAWNGSEDNPILHGVSPLRACGEEGGLQRRGNIPIVCGNLKETQDRAEEMRFDKFLT